MTWRAICTRLTVSLAISLAAVALVNQSIVWNARNRSTEVSYLVDFATQDAADNDLRTVSFGGIDVTQDELISSLERLTRSLTPGDSVASQRDQERAFMLFLRMLHVETTMGGSLDIYPPLAAFNLVQDYGIAQITPDTAKRVFTRVEANPELRRYLSPSTIAAAAETDDKHRIEELLDLRGDGSALWGYLAFFGLLVDYASEDAMGLAIDTDSRDPDRRLRGRFGVSLAVSAYSSQTDGPTVAKLQTYLNDIWLLDCVAPPVAATATPGPLLDVDGDYGPRTKSRLQIISGYLTGTPFAPSRKTLPATAIDMLHPAWRECIEGLFDEATPIYSDAARKISMIISSHYELLGLQYRLLTDPAFNVLSSQSEREIAHRIAMEFVESRQGNFPDLFRKAEFEAVFPAGDFERYRNLFVANAAMEMERVDLFAGYVPMYFKHRSDVDVLDWPIPRIPLLTDNLENDDQNVIERLRIFWGESEMFWVPRAVRKLDPSRHAASRW